MTTLVLPGSATVVAAGDLLASEFGDELVILNLRDGVYYGLEDVGARIWKLLQKPVSVIAICDEIVAEYDVEPRRCERDLRSLLGELLAKGLVEIREGA
jgi:hypothetical protein